MLRTLRIIPSAADDVDRVNTLHTPVQKLAMFLIHVVDILDLVGRRQSQLEKLISAIAARVVQIHRIACLRRKIRMLEFWVAKDEVDFMTMHPTLKKVCSSQKVIISILALGLVLVGGIALRFHNISTVAESS